MVDFSIPGYEDLTPIGRGGSATVYRARQTSLGGRDVAIKVIADVDLDADTRRRFEQECAAAGQLSWHPNVVSTYDAGITDDNRAFLVMEYLPNGSLGTRLGQQGPLPWQDVADIGAKVADALAAAHEVGLIHRDVKPENILLSPRGEPMLGDFGIAYLTSRTRGQTAVVATIAHAAPEILAGARPDERADIYSLGSTLYMLLAGKPAFADDTDESIVTLIGRIATAPVPDLRTEGIPDPLCTAVERCLERDPARRAQKASGAQRSLEDALANPTPVGTSILRHATAPTITVELEPNLEQLERSPNAALPSEVVLQPAASGQWQHGETHVPLPVVHLAGTPHSLWALRRGQRQLCELDPETGAERRRINLPGKALGMAADGRYLWFTGIRGGTGIVSTMETASGALLESSGLSSIPVAIDAGEGAQAWILTNSHVTNIGTDVEATVSPHRVGGHPVAIAATGEMLWVASAAWRQATLYRVDLGTSETVPVVTLDARPIDVVWAADALWVLTSESIWRWSPGDAKVSPAYQMPQRPVSITCAAGALWVADNSGIARYPID